MDQHNHTASLFYNGILQFTLVVITAGKSVFQRKTGRGNKSYVNIDFIDKADSFVIYGAGQVSHRLLRFLSGDGARLKKCRGIAVSGMEGNPSEIMGIPIYEKSECFPAKTDAVIIATFENVHMEILRMLVNEGVCNVKAIMNGLGESLNVTC